MITLTQLLSHEIEEVLVTPLLRQAVVRYVRNLFYGGSPVSSCDSSVRNFFRRLQLEGAEKQKKLDNMKYQLKPGIFIVHNSQSYNSSTMTDEIAEDYLAKFPNMAKNFIMPKEAPVKTEKEKLIERAGELGIEGKSLSIKKLKEAIADKELELQNKKREDLILQAIELDIEVADDITTEELEAIVAKK